LCHAGGVWGRPGPDPPSGRREGTRESIGKQKRRHVALNREGSTEQGERQKHFTVGL